MTPHWLMAFQAKGQHVVSWISAHPEDCMVVLTFILALCAAVSCFFACKSVKAMKEMERERVRPMVVLEFLQEIPFYGVRLRNTGLTAARDIAIHMTPKLERYFGNGNDRAIRFLDGKIEFLAPNASFQAILGTLPDIGNANKTLVFKGTIQYSDASGRRYEDAAVLDYSLFDGTGYASKKTLNDIASALGKISQAVDKLGNASRKLQVLV